MRKGFFNLKTFTLGILLVFLSMGFNFPLGSGGADQANFPDIYIDGASGGDGSLASPYTALSDVNWTTGGDNSIFDYLAGSPAASPTIHLKKATTWLESMEVGASGTATYPIVITSYDTGADPVIDGSDLVTTWTAATVVPTIDDDFEPDGSASGNWETAGGAADTVVFNGGLASREFDKVSEWLQETVTTPYYYADFYYRVDSDSGTTANHIVRVAGCEGSAWNGVNGVQLWLKYSGGYLLSLGRGGALSGATFGISSDTWYHVQFEIDTATDVAKFWVDGDLKSTLSSLALTSDALNIRIGNASYNSGTFEVNVDDVKVYTSDPNIDLTDVWEAALATDPRLVIFDDVYGKPKTSVVALVADEDWYWSDALDKLYIFSDSDPNGRTIESYADTFNFKIDGKSYITVENIKFRVSGWNNITVIGDSDNITFDGITTNHAYVAGIQVDTDDTVQINDLTITDSTVAFAGLNGIDVREVADCLISGNTVYNNCLRGTASTHGIRASNTVGSTYFPTDITIENNTVYRNGYFADDTQSSAATTVGKGIHVDVGGSGHIIRYNKSYNNNSYGIHVEIIDDAQVYYNLCYGNTNAGAACGIAVTGHTNFTLDGNSVYNNVCYANDIGIGAWGSDSLNNDQFTNNLFKNNILFDNTTRELVAKWGAENDGTVGSGNVYVNNCLGVEAASFIEWGVGVYKSTYDDWETSYGATTNSVEADPLMTDPANGDFTLQATSPCIDAGVDVSLTEDYVGAGLVGAPDIGAYELQYSIAEGIAENVLMRVLLRVLIRVVINR